MLISPTTTVAPSAAHLRKKPSPIPEAPPFSRSENYAFGGGVWKRESRDGASGLPIGLNKGILGWEVRTRDDNGLIFDPSLIRHGISVNRGGLADRQRIFRCWRHYERPSGLRATLSGSIAQERRNASSKRVYFRVLVLSLVSSVTRRAQWRSHFRSRISRTRVVGALRLQLVRID